ncbi:hypothetical protein F4815DRAFT_114625 [Daldinia loculata]|nr:hypothetical protein F4815DRAFT_114625 [Daldinia loculata]
MASAIGAICKFASLSAGLLSIVRWLAGRSWALEPNWFVPKKTDHPGRTGWPSKQQLLPRSPLLACILKPSGCLPPLSAFCCRRLGRVNFINIDRFVVMSASIMRLTWPQIMRLPPQVLRRGIYYAPTEDCIFRMRHVHNQETSNLPTAMLK